MSFGFNQGNRMGPGDVDGLGRGARPGPVVEGRDPADSQEGGDAGTL